MDEPQYISVTLLAKRLLGGQTLTDELSADFTRLIVAASSMIQDRCVPFDETAPPAVIQQATLMLAMRMRQAETGNYTTKDGVPIQVKVWTPDIENVLGSWLARDDPEDSLHEPVAGSLDMPAGHQWAAHIEQMRGRRRPWGLL